ncbi:MAG: hypothetical protein AB7I41_01115 [Candidatus Sericytochromatia bacterium]
MNPHYNRYLTLLNELLEGRLTRALSEDQEDEIIEEMSSCWFELDDSHQRELRQIIRTDPRRKKLYRQQLAERARGLKKIKDSVRAFSINQLIPESEWENGSKALIEKFSSKIKSSIFGQGTLSFADTVVGKGANGPGLLVDMSNLSGIKILGNRRHINDVLYKSKAITDKNMLASWLHFAKSIPKKFEIYKGSQSFLSSSISAFIALEKAIGIYNSEGISEVKYLQFLFVHDILLDSFSSMHHEFNKEFKYSPERMYVISIRLNDNIFLFEMTSLNQFIRSTSYDVSYGAFYRYLGLEDEK